MRPKPRVCLLPAATGDHPAPVSHFVRVAASHSLPPSVLPTATGAHPEPVVSFYRAAATPECRPSTLPLFKREVDALRAFLMEQDVIWVAGGNTANALAVWRVNGVDTILREAWEAGCVMT